ncbi:succinate dehydrogenase iron-sulfur subunit [Candidatus Formimonas warabiya]|uniref:succinate dehydrogenase n=1 Tax=Formimonas warabiya TaxID=1761012 RepID=A0A3G1KUD3_FORW1|nr:succinate dehydrogenase iron-sulfur subunit [Candidatus Formimonas warabiya]ATW26078.1 succinate dehydrogenase iron-sulfur subunit [Candidatus Formimonas warabiya]
MDKQIQLKIKRQDQPGAGPYWEEFRVPYKPNMNIVSVLMEIRKNPVNARGESTNPVVWECNCLEEVCGACTMLINGVPRQSCSALIDKIYEKTGFGTPITLAPLSKFPVIRDLMVDRKIMFDNLKKVKAWVPVDGSFAIGRGPRFTDRAHRWAYIISRCMTCGCCMEACPNVSAKSQFIGPAAIAQVRLFNVHPIGAMHQEERFEALVGAGGIQECGNAQNCRQVCPKEIPLTTHIAAMNRQSLKYTLKRWFTT